jgi:GT2 family glycosyltransferase
MIDKNDIPVCTIIIVSFNVADKLRDCINSIYEYTKSVTFEIIVVDNDSKDNSVSIVKNDFPQVKLIESKENLGFAAANNLAIKSSNSKYALCLNPDTVLIEDAISSVADYLDNNSNVGICSCSQIGPDMSHGPTARPIPNAYYKLLVMLGLANPDSPFSFANELQYTGNDPVSADYVVGAFFMCRRTCLDQVGLFDERFFLYYEEVDLCMRVKVMDWKVILLPAVRVIHDHGSSAKAVKTDDKTSNGSQILSFKLKSEYLFFRKNWGLHSVLMNFLVEFTLLAVFAIKKKNRYKFSLFRRESWKALKSTHFGKYSPPKPWK